MTLTINDKACAAHRIHLPKAQTSEWHHIIPVAWQLAFQPQAEPFPGNDTSGRGHLWDSRGVWLCPTGHRNVHYWIVKMMHALHDHGISSPTVAYKEVGHYHHAVADFNIAYQAITRFTEEMLPPSSGSLLRLTQQGLWGQA